MDRPNVVIKQVHITTSDLKGRRAVAEDPLEGEHIAAVCKEGSGEGMAKDVR
jgi:hypothetical protein